MNVNVKDQNIFSAKIHALEKLFVKFYGIDKMPKYIIKYVDLKSNESYNMKILNSTSPMTLCVPKSLLYRKNYDYKSSAIHEFTHMCDYSTLLLDYNENDRSKALSLWSEYHATYIQTIYKISITNENMGEYLLNENGYENFTSYWNEFIEECIQEFKISFTTLEWAHIINCYMNYFGAISAYNKFTNDTITPLNFGFILDDIMQNIFKCISSSENINDIANDLASFKHELNNMCVEYIKNNKPGFFKKD